MNKVITVLIAVVMTIPVSAAAESGTGSAPVLMGKLVYHSYNSYGDGSSRLFVLDFAENEVSCVSDLWTNVTDPMNAVWTHDGKAIVFMGIDRINGSRDLYAYTIGAPGDPLNLTQSPDFREEDPKPNPVEKDKIVYKTTGEGRFFIKTLSLETNQTETVYADTDMELSMPYYSVNGETVYFSGLLTGETDVYSVPAAGGTASKVGGCAEAGVFEYYPVVKDETGFFYARHTPEQPADQIYFKNTVTGEPPKPAAFNVSGYDSSDPCPVNWELTVISGVRPSGKGGYDLYLCRNATGETWPLDLYNGGISTTAEELGADYTESGISDKEPPWLIIAIGIAAVVLLLLLLALFIYKRRLAGRSKNAGS